MTAVLVTLAILALASTLLYVAAQRMEAATVVLARLEPTRPSRSASELRDGTAALWSAVEARGRELP